MELEKSFLSSYKRKLANHFLSRRIELFDSLLKDVTVLEIILSINYSSTCSVFCLLYNTAKLDYRTTWENGLITLRCDRFLIS